MEAQKEYRLPTHWAIEYLQDVSAQAGLEVEEVIRVLDAGLEVDHLLDYLDAVVRDRMN